MVSVSGFFSRQARVVAALARVSISQLVQYRIEALIEGVLSLLGLGTALVPLWVVFGNRTTIEGWSYPEMLVVVGWFTVLKAFLEGTINPSLLAVIDHIRKGTLDFVLLKPADAQFLVSTARFDPWHVIDGLGALVLIGVAAHRHHLVVGGAAPGGLAPGAAVLLLGCAVLMIYALWLLVVCAAFYVVRIDNLSYLFTSVFDFARWPRSVFRGVLGVVFTYVLPLAVMTSFPADALLGKLRPTEALWAVACTAALLLGSRVIWRRAIANYTSASS